MIRKIKFSNFYSFEGEEEIDFLTTKKSDNFSFFESKNIKKKEQITKIAGFAGGNASGKTNVMRFLSFMKHFVTTQVPIDENNNIAIKSFFNNNEESSFYIEFEQENKIFFYDFTIKENFIITENLYIQDLKDKKNIKKLLFKKKNDLDF
jgi:AAA15 family ATPase/GTPase